MSFVCYKSLNCCMDGQLGFDGNNAVVPRMIEQFLTLGAPDSLEDDSKTNHKEPIKV